MPDRVYQDAIPIQLGERSEPLPAYRVTMSDGSSYVTSMAKGVTLEDARAYFLGQSLVQSDERTMLRVTNVETA